MLEVLSEFEHGAIRFSSLVLILPGIVAVVAGLFVWLGGAIFRRILGAVIGAISGIIAIGFFVAWGNTIWLAVCALVGAIIAVMFQRIFFAILLAALGVVISFFVLAGPYIKQVESPTPINWDTASVQGETLSIHESIKMIKVYVTDVGERIKQSYSLIPLYKWAIIAALAIAFLTIGLVFRRICLALSCATLGTVLIFAGMIFALLYKGSKPISGINAKSSFYSVVFLAMVVFGTAEQLVLCAYSKRRVAKRKKQKELEQKKIEQ